jgi:hypothetical protein
LTELSPPLAKPSHRNRDGHHRDAIADLRQGAPPALRVIADLVERQEVEPKSRRQPLDQFEAEHPTADAAVRVKGPRRDDKQRMLPELPAGQCGRVLPQDTVKHVASSR